MRKAAQFLNEGQSSLLNIFEEWKESLTSKQKLVKDTSFEGVGFWLNVAGVGATAKTAWKATAKAASKAASGLNSKELP